VKAALRAASTNAEEKTLSAFLLFKNKFGIIKYYESFF
jgi:hypothetical protein